MSRVDAHHHLWDVASRDYPWMDGVWADPLRGRFDVPALAKVVAPHDVTATVVVQAVSDLDETRELLALGSPLVAGVVGWVDLTAPDVADVLAGLVAGPGRLVGVRHQVQDEPDPRWLLRDDVVRGLRAVAAAGLAYDLLVKPPQMPAAIEVVRALPEVRFVLDHLGKPDIVGGGQQPWADGITALAAGGNVAAKLSGLVTEADWAAWTPAQLTPYARHALVAFGPDRLMFGSDWPVCTLAASYEQVVAFAESVLAEAGLDPAGRDAVFGGTACHVYRL